MIAWSTSSPPRCVSPAVESTWKKSVRSASSASPGTTLSSEMSNVPPPRSNTAIVSGSGFATPIPYASAAAVGSFTIRTASSPASRAASRVAWRWASSKYAGTVITARFVHDEVSMPSFRRPASARSRSARRIAADTSCGASTIRSSAPGAGGRPIRAVRFGPSTTS